MAEIPEGWTQACLEQLLSGFSLFKDGDWVESKDQNPEGEVRLIQLADIGDGCFLNKSNRRLTKEKAYDLKCSFLKQGDILVARMPDPLGRACIFPFNEAEKFVTVVDVCIFRTNFDLISNRFLTYLINSPKSRGFIEQYKTGSTRKRISRKNLAKINFPIPPLNEQKRIVAKIEELFSELDKGIESLKKAREQLTLYRQAVLKQAFEGKLTNKSLKDGEFPAGWRLMSISEIGKIKGGKRLPPKHYYADFETDYIYIMAGNLKDGTVKHNYKYLHKETFDALVNYQVTGGEVYITIVGACIGDAGVIPDGIGKAILTENAAKIIDLKNVLNKYLSSWINSIDCQLQIKRKILSATLGKLALRRIGTLEIPIPDTIEEQQKIVNLIETQFSIIDQLESDINTNLKKAETLRQSILKKAFSGQLVPQDQNDEPASILLEKIKTEKAKLNSSKKRKKGVMV